MLIDFHAHLTDFNDSETQNTLKRAHDAGVERVVNTGTSVDSSKRAVSQSSENKGMYAAVGISPFDTVGAEPGFREEISGLTTSEDVIGIGETGLDYSKPGSPAPEVQEQVFESMLETAADTSLPLIVHSRGAEERVLEMCRSYSVERCVFHCYTGELKLLSRIFDSGYFVSYSGIVTFNKADFDSHIRYSPDDLTLIETDTPYLAPVPERGKPNQPAFLINTARYVAGVRGIGIKGLEMIQERNFKELFGV
ncbi:MAG: TatD family hydrolase [Chitinivibrionales bacterium]